MDDLSIVFSKLRSLHNYITSTLNGGESYYDLSSVKDFFERHAQLRDQLRAIAPELYADYPIRAIFKPSITSDNQGRGYITRHQLFELNRDLNAIIQIWDNVQATTFTLPPMKITREGVFFAGQYFDALQKTNDILNEAKHTINIIDGYIDEKVLQILSSKAGNISVNILTKNVSQSLKVAAEAFQKQYGKLSIRTSTAFHDRFIIIDNRSIYHFGASIKDLGNRGFMFSAIEEPVVISSILEQWDKEWEKATIEL